MDFFRNDDRDPAVRAAPAQSLRDLVAEIDDYVRSGLWASERVR
jgi:hypothetical protein